MPLEQLLVYKDICIVPCMLVQFNTLSNARFLEGVGLLE